MIRVARKKYPVFCQEEASRLFFEAFVVLGTCIADCQACGRGHISSESGIDWEENERENFFAKQKDDPDGFINHDDSVHLFNWEGKQIIVECPCNYAGFLENWLWFRRNSIMGYFTARARVEKTTADKTINRVIATNESLTNKSVKGMTVAG